MTLTTITSCPQEESPLLTLHRVGPRSSGEMTRASGRAVWRRKEEGRWTSPAQLRIQTPSDESITTCLFFPRALHWKSVLGSSLRLCSLASPGGFQESRSSPISLSLPNSLHWWQEAPGPLWQALGSAHDVASPCCQVPATRSAWKRQIRAGRVRKPLPAGRQDWQPEAGLSKLQPLWPELPWNKSVKGMVWFWQRAKGAQMEKKAWGVNRLGAGLMEGHQGIPSTCFPRLSGRGSRKGPVSSP